MKTRNIPLLIATIIYGVIFAFIGEPIYSKLIELWYKPFVIGLYFFVFSLFLFVTVYMFSKEKQKIFSQHLIRDITLTLIAIFSVSLCLEIIYEIGGKTVYNEPTSYIFVIDDSGSMQDNDPNAERIQAITAIMNDKDADFKYAVYVFDSDYRLVRSMEPKKFGLKKIELQTTGGTAITATLKGVTLDIETGVIDGGDYPRILLLSDGQSGDSFGGTASLRKEIKKLQERGITISTVGLGNSVDSSFMNSLAKKTGGVYINVDNIDELSIAMKEAINSYADRDLLGVRPYNRLNWLYAIIRVIFVFVIASCIMVVKCLACGGSDFNKIILVCTSLNLFAALLLEIGLNYIVVSGLITHVLMCVLLSVIMNYYIIKSRILFDEDCNFEKRVYNGDSIVEKNKSRDYRESLK